MVAQMKPKNYNAAPPPPANSTPSFRLDVGRPDDLAPDLGLDFDAVSELLRRACDHFEAERRQALLHVRQGKNCRDLALERADNLVRRSGGRQEAHPTVTLDLRIAGLCGRRYVGKELRARLARHRQCPQLPGFERLHGRRQRTPDDRGVAAPLKGTCTRSSASDRRSISPNRWPCVPTPPEAKLYFPGLDLISVTSSLRLRAGSDGWTVMTLVAATASVTGARSLSASNGSLAKSVGFTT